MPNLTIDHKLVKPVPDTNPVPGHDLVIFRKLGEGRRYHTVLGPDEKLGATDRLLFGSRLETYAVTKDQNLRHRFTLEDLRSQEGIGPFSLSFTLSLSVADARELVEGLERDPLRRLQEEIEEVMGGLARRMSWEEIERPSDEVETQLVNADVRDETGRRITCLERLRGLALDLGLTLRAVQIARTLSPEFGKENQALQDARREEKILEAQHLVEQKRRVLQGQLDEAQAWKVHALGNIERIGKISESAAGNLARALSQITDKVDTAPALRGVLQELLSMREQILALASGPGNGAAAPELKLVGDKPAALLGAGNGSALSGLVTRSLRLVDKLECEPEDRNRLSSLVLHLLGEVALRERADFAIVEGYANRLGEEARKVMGLVKTDQEFDELLRQLQNPSVLRATL